MEGWGQARTTALLRSEVPRPHLLAAGLPRVTLPMSMLAESRSKSTGRLGARERQWRPQTACQRQFTQRSLEKSPWGSPRECVANR